MAQTHAPNTVLVISPKPGERGFRQSEIKEIIAAILTPPFKMDGYQITEWLSRRFPDAKQSEIYHVTQLCKQYIVEATMHAATVDQNKTSN